VAEFDLAGGRVLRRWDTDAWDAAAWGLAPQAVSRRVHGLAVVGAPETPPPSAPSADLVVGLEGVTGAAAVVGEEFTYGVRVRNEGPDASTGVAVPGAVELVRVDRAYTSGAGGVVVVPIGAMPAGVSAVVRVTVRPRVAGAVDLGAEARGNVPDPSAANNVATARLEVREPAPPLVQVAGLRRLGRAAQPARIELAFTAELDPGVVPRSTLYTLELLPPVSTRQRPTPKPQRVALGRVRYDASTRTVTLVTRVPLAASRLYRLTVSDGLKGRAGQALDGDRDGRAGGNYRVTLRGSGAVV
jgi:hypothetical protein